MKYDRPKLIYEASRTTGRVCKFEACGETPQYYLIAKLTSDGCFRWKKEAAGLKFFESEAEAEKWLKQEK